LKNREKKSFFTTVALFFIPLMFFSNIVFYMYHEDKIASIEESILYQMKDYTFDFKGDTFSLDIIEDTKEKQVFKIYHCEIGLCAYFQIPSAGPYLLKVVFDKDKYEKIYNEFLIQIFKIWIVIFFFIFFISISFAAYALRPMRESIYLLEEFLKDIIHDLNTPATSILLNSRLLRKRGNFEEIDRIELSAKSISSLYKNLEFMSSDQITKDEKIYLKEIVGNRVEILKKLYPKINFSIDIISCEIQSNKNAMERIVDNLLTNACKYNKKNGQVNISAQNNKLIIEDTGVGIKNTKKVFQRYYKENTNGLGIGMSIVKKLCDFLEIKINLESSVGRGTKVTLIF